MGFFVTLVNIISHYKFQPINQYSICISCFNNSQHQKYILTKHFLTMNNFEIKFAKEKDAGIILKFIKQLAEYENLSNEVLASEDDLKTTLFCENSNAEVVIGYLDNIPISFALFFHNYSTFLGKKGLYLEDLFVVPEHRRNGYGKIILKFLANIAIERNCGRFEWAVLDWNKPAIKFYKSIGADLKNEWILTRLTGKALINFTKKK